MKINHVKVKNAIERAMKLQEVITETDHQISKLKDIDRVVGIYAGSGSDIQKKLEGKTISVIRTLAIADLEAYKEPLVKELNDILTGGIIND